MKKLLIYALVFGLAFTPTFGWASSVLFAGGQGQQVVYRGTVTGLRISAVDGTAFLDNLPSAVTDSYVTGDYQIEVYDSAGRMLKGVLKAVGTGETVTDLVGGTDPTLLNGDFETGDPPTGWSTANATIAQAANPRTGSSGTKSMSVRRDGSGAMAYRQLTHADKTLIKYSYWRKGCGFDGGIIGLLLASTNIFLDDANYYADTWEGRSGYVTATFANANVGINQQGTIGWTGFVDDIVIQQVLTPSTSGATIVSTKGGSTGNWQFKHASFTWNATSYYLIIKKLR